MIEMKNIQMIETLNSTLQSLNLDAKCVAATEHRHFAFYDVKLGTKCPMTKISSRAREIALNLHSQSDPIIKLLRKEGLVRLQLVTGDPKPLPLLDLLKKHPKPEGILPFLLGETDDGQVLWNDMAQNPHMLIAGSTGSGKSVLLHNLIANAINVGNVKLFLVDPKGVEFSAYASPEMTSLVTQVVYDYAAVLEMLESIIHIMDERYEMLKELGIQNIEQAPKLFKPILVIIDEVSELMLKDGKGKRFENLILKLAQKSRAAGIYLVLATQHPSVKVLTGLIKANFAARMACKVSSRTDSQVVLDHPGAELLIGRGDAIIKNMAHDLVRLQVAYIDTKSVIWHFRHNKSI